MSLGHALGPYATLNTFHDMRQKILFFCSALFMENYNMLTLFQADCTISYSATGAVGWYAVALMLEDYSPTSLTPLSMVPLQFLFILFESESPCSEKPSKWVNFGRLLFEISGIEWMCTTCFSRHLSCTHATLATHAPCHV